MIKNEVRARKSYQKVSSELQRLYRPHADKVWKGLKDESAFVITGPFGIGKSQSLIPQIKASAPRNLTVRSVDCQMFIHSESLLDYVPVVDEGVIILDEAGTISDRGSQDVIDVLKGLHLKHWKVVPVISYYIDSPHVRERSTADWLSAEASLTGRNVQKLHLDSLTLSKGLATDFILAQKGRSWPVETLEYIFATVPLIPRILWLLGTEYYMDIPHTRDNILDQIDHNWPGMVPDRERERIRQQLLDEKYAEYLKLREKKK